MTDKPARPAPPGTRYPDGTLRMIHTGADRLDVATAYFRFAMDEVAEKMRAYAETGPAPDKLVGYTAGTHRAVKALLSEIWAEAKTQEHMALTTRRDATAQDDASQALIAELEGRIASLEARVSTLEDR